LINEGFHRREEGSSRLKKHEVMKGERDLIKPEIKKQQQRRGEEEKDGVAYASPPSALRQL